VKDINPEAKVILYGSRARNHAHKDSDWDILT
jgi:predicted nucleotidyltransferase